MDRAIRALGVNPVRPPPADNSEPDCRHHRVRRFNKPALGPVGDCLDDLEPPFGGNAA